MRNTLCVLAVLTFALGNPAYAQQSVLQRGYDPGLSGANLSETTLNTTNVTPTTFGLAFTLPVDDRIYAQPLYVPQVTIAGQGAHNVVYVATMSDTLYAFDADAGGPALWSINFASNVGALPVPIADFVFSGNSNIVGNLGILSTPVIDPSTNIMYLVACTLEGGALVYRLHAVDIRSGTEPYTNVVISGTYDGVTFDAAHQTQRVSLTLSGNQVVFGFAAMEAESSDVGGYSGWVMAYNKQTLVPSGIFATVVTGSQGGGVWQSGRAPVVDGAGFVYVFTGNGYQNGYNGTNDFSETALKLDPANGLALVDWFTPGNWSSLDAADLDLSSSGPLLVPNTSPSLLAGGGKGGVLYLLNTTNLGHYSATDMGVVQEQTISASSIRGGPVYWQRAAANGGPLLYDWGTSDWVKAYAFNGAKFAASPTYQGSGTQIYPGGILALSANGETQGSGVLWATVAASGNVYNDGTDPGVLYAFDADDVSTELWSSTMNSARDNFGNFAKFVPPLVANGKVYVATFSDKVAVYGLLAPSKPITATPTVSPAAGTYTGPQQVTLSDAIAGAVIYYTTNGTTPTISSAQYVAGTPLSVSATETIEAIAVASGYANSAAASATYTISASGTTPTSVNLSTEDAIVGIANAGTPVSSGGIDGGGQAYAEALLGTSITWSGSTFALGSAGVVDAVSGTTIILPAGNYSTLQLLGTGVNGNQGNQSFVVTYTDGTTTKITQSLSDWYTPQNYAGESIVSTMAYRISPSGDTDNRTFYLYGYSFAINSAKTVASITLPTNRDVVVLALDLVGGSSQPAAATPTFSLAAGTYTGPQQVTLSDATAGAVIYYTTNGTTPTISSAQYVAGTPLSVSATETIEAIAVASGYANSAAASATYTISAEPITATPTVSPAAGTYTGPQQVTLSDAIAGAVIYYTTNGTTPTISSAQYVAGTPLSVSATETIEAIAVASGYANSAAASATYTISAEPITATPTVSPAAGTYTGPQQVTLSDAIAGAVIYYTTNGTTPTISSAQYVAGTPLSVSATETIEAIAVASGYANSAAASATYTISASGTTPTSVNLSTEDAIVGIANAGTPVSSGGIDGGGQAYAEALLGTSITWSGSTFALGSAGVVDAVSGTTIILPAGNYSTLQLLGTGVNGNQGNQSFVVTYTDGTTTKITQSLSDWYTPQNYAGESIVSTMAYRISPSGDTDNRTFYLYGYSFAINSAKTVASITLPTNRDVVVLALDLVGGSSQPAAATPTFSLAAGTYTGPQQVTLSDATAGAVIYYTTNGTTPTISSAQYVAGTPLSVSATETIEAIAVASGYANSAAASATYTISAEPITATPTVSPAAGTYTGPQQVTLSDAIAGAVIYYTTNGTTPTISSAQYVAGTPLSVSATETIEAIAVASGYANSAAASATYTISAEPITATPTVSPAAGTYTGPQQVTLSDAIAGAVIYYTTNGTTPTISSAQYVAGTPLSVSATETIEAIAVASGYANSAAASATYTISASGTTPTSVNLSTEDAIVGIANAGTPVSSGGIDGGGQAYAEALLGTSITWSGSTFALGSAGVVDAVSGTTIILPAGNYSTLQLLGTGVNGNQGNQSFVVTYTDGTTTKITQSLSDWYTPQNYAGESIVSTMAYRISPSGDTDNRTFYLYGYSFAINSAKTVASITLPTNRDVVVLAVDLHP